MNSADKLSNRNDAHAFKGVHHVSVSADRAGQRLDNFLLAYLPGSPRRGLVYRLIRTGQVRVNGARAKPLQKLRVDDDIRIPPFKAVDTSPVQLSQRLLDDMRERIIYADEFQLVVDKPSGMAVHAGSGLRFGVIDLLKALYPQHPDIALIHRLDRETSGCLMAGFTRQAQVQQQQALKRGEISKRYLTLLCGKVREKHWQVDEPLLKVSAGKRSKVQVDATGKTAVTEFRVLEEYPHHTLVEAEPITGRTHQIRVHAAQLGCPVAGDSLYGQRERNPSGLDRLFLHAQSLRLNWPDDILVNVELPDALRHCLDRLS